MEHKQRDAKPTTKLVDFFIVGEAKSGTTALAQFLSEHHDIGMSNPKEPHYFATDSITECDEFHGGKKRHFTVRTAEQYAACFSHCQDAKLWGEGSTHYIYSTEAAKNIHDYNPKAKIIIMLRNPVDFIHSLHMQYVNNATEDEADFAAALAKESVRKQGRDIPARTRCPSYLYYSERVKYTSQIQRYYDQFPRSQILFIINEEFNRDNAGTVRRVLEFLGADPDFQPAFTTVHASKTPRFMTLHHVLNSLIFKSAVQRLVGPQHYERVKNTAASVFLKEQPRIPLDQDLRQRLMQDYESEVHKVAACIQRTDLPKLWGYGA